MPDELRQQLRQRRQDDVAALRQMPAGGIAALTVTQLEISATALRQMFRRGNSRYLLPDAVIDFIGTRNYISEKPKHCMDTENLKKDSPSMPWKTSRPGHFTLDVSKLSSLFECLIIASDSTRQVRHWPITYAKRSKEAGGDRWRRRRTDRRWVLVDCGNVVVHVMQPAVRGYYNIEGLWGGQKPAFVPQQAANWRDH